MPPEFDLAPVADLPRQRSFLQAVLPILAALESIEAIWLSGSLARRDADSWSSVDCCLLWRAAPHDASAAARRRESMRDALRHALGDGNYLVDRCSQRDCLENLQGITLAQNLPAGTHGQRVAAGVLFAFHWADSTTASELRSRTGPIHPLYFSTRLSGELRNWLKEEVDRLSPPNAEIVSAQLDRFWLVLARLPAVLRRRRESGRARAAGRAALAADRPGGGLERRQSPALSRPHQPISGFCATGSVREEPGLRSVPLRQSGAKCHLDRSGRRPDCPLPLVRAATCRDLRDALPATG